MDRDSKPKNSQSIMTNQNEDSTVTTFCVAAGETWDVQQHRLKTEVEKDAPFEPLWTRKPER